jgi:short-subunit dehydrogenase
MNVIITGASRGIGKAIAAIFASNGHSLFITSKQEAGLRLAAEDLKRLFPNSSIEYKAFDLSMEAAGFGEWLLSEGVEVDVLVNNAGSFAPGQVQDEPQGLLEQQLSTNLLSAYHTYPKLLPSMMKKSGHIFNICSIASLKAYPNGGAYSISKYALHGFSQNLRMEMMPYQIKVTAVFPGAVLTDSWGDYDNSNARIMEANDIAKMIYAATQLSPGACVEDIIIRPQLGDL